MTRLAILAITLALTAVSVTAIEIVDVTCNENNDKDKNHGFNIVVHAANARPGFKAMLRINNAENSFEDVVCAEWDNRLELIETSASIDAGISQIVNADGTIKWRVPTDSCDDADVEFFFVASQADRDGDSKITGDCDHSSVAQLGKFMGSQLLLEIPRFNGAADDDLQKAIQKVAYHTLYSNDDHSQRKQGDITVELSDKPAMIHQYEIVGEDHAPGAAVSGSVYATIKVPATDYNHAQSDIRHARREFDQDENTRGLGRRGRDQGSESLEKEIEAELKRIGHHEPSMGNVVLVDSQIWREFKCPGDGPPDFACDSWGGNSILVDNNCDLYNYRDDSTVECGTFHSGCQDSGATGASSEALDEINASFGFAGNDKIVCDGGQINGKDKKVFFVTPAGCETFIAAMKAKNSNLAGLSCAPGSDFGYGSFLGAVPLFCDNTLIETINSVGSLSCWSKSKAVGR